MAVFCWILEKILGRFLCNANSHTNKSSIFAAALAKGMPCKSATVPAAVSLRKVCHNQATVRPIRMGRRQARASQKTCQTG